MNVIYGMQTIYNIAKILHIIGFVTAVGSTLTFLSISNRLWKLYRVNPSQGSAAFRSIWGLQRVALDGILLAVVAGVTMLALNQWSFIYLLWFHIKLTLIVIILIIGLTFGRSTLKQLHIVIHMAETPQLPVLARIRQNLNFYIQIELFLFLIIIFLSVFRFE